MYRSINATCIKGMQMSFQITAAIHFFDHYHTALDEWLGEPKNIFLTRKQWNKFTIVPKLDVMRQWKAHNGCCRVPEVILWFSYTECRFYFPHSIPTHGVGKTLHLSATPLLQWVRAYNNVLPISMNYHITHAPIATSTQKKSFGTVASRMHLKMTTEVSQLQTEEHPVTQRDDTDVTCLMSSIRSCFQNFVIVWHSDKRRTLSTFTHGEHWKRVSPHFQAPQVDKQEKESFSPCLLHQLGALRKPFSKNIIHSSQVCSRWPWASGCWASAPPSSSCLLRPSDSERSETARNSHRRSCFSTQTRRANSSLHSPWSRRLAFTFPLPKTKQRVKTLPQPCRQKTGERNTRDTQETAPLCARYCNSVRVRVQLQCRGR